MFQEQNRETINSTWKSCCVLQDHYDYERDKTVFHNVTETYKTKTKTTACKTKTKTIFPLRPVLSYDRRSQTTSLLVVVFDPSVLDWDYENIPWNSVVLATDFADWNIENSERRRLWKLSSEWILPLMWSRLSIHPRGSLLSSDSVGSRIIFLPRVSMHNTQSAILIYHFFPSVRPLPVLCLNDGTYKTFSSHALSV